MLYDGAAVMQIDIETTTCTCEMMDDYFNKQTVAALAG
jgi:hypothetical protein